MSKREILAAVALVTGVAMLGTLTTAPVGAVLVAGGLYLLALPRIGRRQHGARRPRGPQGRT
jgi:hypothetical protein